MKIIIIIVIIIIIILIITIMIVIIMIIIIMINIIIMIIIIVTQNTITLLDATGAKFSRSGTSNFHANMKKNMKSFDASKGSMFCPIETLAHVSPMLGTENCMQNEE